MTSSHQQAVKHEIERLSGFNRAEVLSGSLVDGIDLARLDHIAADELKHQPHLVSLLDKPSLLNNPWEPTNIVEGWKAPESVMPQAIPKKGLISDYHDIRLTPYNPRVWIGRAGIFLGLGYGELAVADVYKARLLVDTFLHPQLTPVYLSCLASVIMKTVLTEFPRVLDESEDDYRLRLREQFQTFDQSAILMMSQGLMCSRAQYDATQVLREALRRYPNHVLFKALLQKAERGVQTLIKHLKMQGQEGTQIEWAKKIGRLSRQAYPWIVPEELDRGTKAIKKLKTKFEAASSNSCIGPNSHDPTSGDSFGVFAKQDIRMGDKILQDKSIFGAYNIPGGNFCWACSARILSGSIALECCKVRFCSESCRVEAMCSYHRVLCKKDFKWLYDECKDADPMRNEMVPVLMMKILATAVQQGTSAKVLKMACVGTLKPNYGSEIPSFFQLFDNIIAPLKVLQTLGVDVFAESRFDSWVLQTLFWRIENNKQSARLVPMQSGASLAGHIGGGIEVAAIRRIKARRFASPTSNQSYLKKRDVIESWRPLASLANANVVSRSYHSMLLMERTILSIFVHWRTFCQEEEGEALTF